MTVAMTRIPPYGGENYPVPPSPKHLIELLIELSLHPQSSSLIGKGGERGPTRRRTRYKAHAVAGRPG